jgi:glycogen debranching enzyme
MRAVTEPEVVAGPGTVTAIAGLTFAISDEIGDMGPGPLGLIARDTRHLSRFQVFLAGVPLRYLAAALLRSDIALFRGYALTPGRHPDPPIAWERRRHVWEGGFEERIELRCWAPEGLDTELTVRIEADFADIFEVRSLGAGQLGAPSVPARRAGDEVRLASPDGRRTTRIRFAPAPHRQDEDGCHWTLRMRRGERRAVSLSVRVEDGDGSGQPVAARRGDSSEPEVAIRSEPDLLARACRRSLADFERLSMPDALEPRRRLLAAGIPWFVALFGRDSLISGHQARAFQPDRMIDTLRALAARQGRRDDPGNEEEPGKILHEVRLTDRPWLGEGTLRGARAYYGSIDATPLFLMLLGTAWRWGAPEETVRELLPAARAALDWLRGPADPDGDGLLEYRPRSGRSLRNQGWKDSENAIQFADGRLAEGPIALLEVQGYAYRARRDMAAVLGRLGCEDEADRLADEADDLRTLIRDRYWLGGPDGNQGFFAVALDGGKRPVDAVASNVGHLLWCGVPSNAEAEQVAARLAHPSLSSGWGLRTLSSEMAGFNPIGYHVGSVWPHDTAIACEGLRRYGLEDTAHALAGGLCDALDLFDQRLPELFGGHAREPGDFPVPYPTACRPQAWAAGVPLSLVSLFLGLEPSVPDGVISLSPLLPPGHDVLEVRGIPFPSGPLSVAVDAGGAHVYEAPHGLALELRPRVAGAEAPASKVASGPAR